MLKKLALVIVMATLLSGCIPLVLGGAATVVMAAVYIHDKRTAPEINSDQQIQQSIRKKLSTPIFSNECNIQVTVFNGYVLLTGQAPTKELKIQAQRIALTTHGIMKLYNEIIIASPSSELTRAKDYWITTRIKVDIMKNKSLQTAQLTIITQQGTVYLMGSVTNEQANKIVTLASQISGVTQVIKIFPNEQAATW